MASYYVRRVQIGDAYRIPSGTVRYIGPIRSHAQALREVAAWESSEGSFGQRWRAEALPSSPEIKATVRANRRARQQTS